MRFPSTLEPSIHHKSTTIHHPKTAWKTRNPLQKRHLTTQKNLFPKSTLVLERLPGEVIKRVGQQREHQNTYKVVVQRIVIAEARNRALSRSFIEFHANPDQTNDAARSDQPRRVQAAGRDFGFNGSVASRNGVEDRPSAGISMGGIRGIKVRVLSEPGFAIGVPKRERSFVLKVGLACGLAMHDKV